MIAILTIHGQLHMCKNTCLCSSDNHSPPLRNLQIKLEWDATSIVYSFTYHTHSATKIISVRGTLHIKKAFRTLFIHQDYAMHMINQYKSTAGLGHSQLFCKIKK